MKIYRETLEALAKENGLSVAKVGEKMGRDATWLYKKMPKGWGLFSEIETIAMASVVGCPKDALTQIPVSESGRERMNGASVDAMDDILSEVQDSAFRFGG